MEESSTSAPRWRAAIQSRRRNSCATRWHKNPARRFQVFSAHSHRNVSISFPRRTSSLEITAEGQVQIHAFAQAGGADLSELDFRGKVFPDETQDGEHIDLALVELLPAELHRIGTARNCVAKRAFAFM